MRPVVDVPPLPAKYFREEKKGPSYKQQARIEEGISIEEMLDKFGETEIKLSQKELLAMAPKLREALKDLLSKRRVPTGENNAFEASMIEEDTKNEWLYTNVKDLGKAKKVQTVARDKGGELVEVWEVEEPLTQYLTTLPPDKRDCLVFTVETSEIKSAGNMGQLRVIPAVINGVREEEALLDSGSQIVTMSREAASDCKIPWDPSLAINMQSANGSITRTCGLAKNVPFIFGNITVYLQVHVIEEAPYRVLLGRPFDVITESKVVNSSSGQQFITITDPNTKEWASLATYDKGELPKTMETNF